MGYGKRDMNLEITKQVTDGQHTKAKYQQENEKNKSSTQTWTWLRREHLRLETETLLIEAYNEDIIINYVMAKYIKTGTIVNMKKELKTFSHILKE